MSTDPNKSTLNNNNISSSSLEIIAPSTPIPIPKRSKRVNRNSNVSNDVELLLDKSKFPSSFGTDVLTDLSLNIVDSTESIEPSSDNNSKKKNSKKKSFSSNKSKKTAFHNTKKPSQLPTSTTITTTANNNNNKDDNDDDKENGVLAISEMMPASREQKNLLTQSTLSLLADLHLNTPKKQSSRTRRYVSRRNNNQNLPVLKEKEKKLDNSITTTNENSNKNNNNTVFKKQTNDIDDNEKENDIVNGIETMKGGNESDEDTIADAIDKLAVSSDTATGIDDSIKKRKKYKKRKSHKAIVI